jgi:hypothetical protein
MSLKNLCHQLFTSGSFLRATKIFVSSYFESESRSCAALATSLDVPARRIVAEAKEKTRPRAVKVLKRL